MSSSDDQVLETLLSWLKANNVWLDDRIYIAKAQGGEETGYGVFAEASIPLGVPVVRTPKTAILSVRNCTRAPAILPLLDTLPDLDPNVALAVGVLSEQLLGDRSRFWGYLQSLPSDGADIGLFWGDESDEGAEAMMWLKGTEAERIVKGPIQVHLQTAFEHIVRVALKDSQPTFAHLRRAYSLVSSRAFHVDIYHGVGLVPVADIFNHAEDNTVFMETDFNVCSHCGVLGKCPHDEYPNRTGPPQDMTCDMVSYGNIVAGDELFNSYDDTGLSNADLLCYYGFTIEGNSNDRIIWTTEDFDCLLSSGGERAIQNLDDLARINPYSGDAYYDAVDEHVGDRLEGSTLLGPVPEPVEIDEKWFDTAFSLDAEGRISFALWLELFERNSPDQDQDSRPLLLDILFSLLRMIENSEADPAPSSFAGIPEDAVRTLRAIAVDVCELCQARLATLYRPELTTSDLSALLDKSLGRRTRLSLSYTLTERIMLETCLMSWEETINFIDAVLKDVG